MEPNLERRIIEIIAADRIDRPISSMSGKLKRMKPKLAKAVDLSELDGDYNSERVYARIEDEDCMKARGLKEGIEKFEKKFPKYGRILKGFIEEQRVMREKHLYFGLYRGCRLTSNDYLGVMENLGFTKGTAERLYPELMNISRNLSKKRDEERSILIG